MSRVIIGILIASLLAGCQSQMIRDDLAPVKAGAASSIVADWARLLQDRYPATTVFEIKGMGKIGTALAKDLRSLGYGVADSQDQSTADSVPIEVRSDKLGDKGILVSLIIEGQIISRSYTVSESDALADSAFSELAAGGKL
mgnify:FL=1